MKAKGEGDKKERGRWKWRKVWIFEGTLLLGGAAVLLNGLAAVLVGAAEKEACWRPEYQAVDLAPIAEKAVWSDADYDLIYRQTGLGKSAADELRERTMDDQKFESESVESGLKKGKEIEKQKEEGLVDELEYYQKRIFEPGQIFREKINVFTSVEKWSDGESKEAGTISGLGTIRKAEKEKREDEIAESEEKGTEAVAVEAEAETEAVETDGRGKGNDCLPFLDLQEGDILITKSGHTLGIRHGHAALVVEADGGKTLEAIAPGTVSKLQTIEKWRSYPSFLQLRLKDEYLTPALGKQIALYALCNLKDVPYGIFSFPFVKYQGNRVESIQCAYLIWEAYRQFGFDVDSDGTFLVLPEDLAKSPYFDVVQAYGVDLEERW